MRICEDGKDIIIKDTKQFDLTHTFDCGQCFRWNRQEEGYFGVAMGKALYITQSGSDITLHNTTLADYKQVWEGYFDLGRDYAKIQYTLSGDPVLSAAMLHGSGIRILAQDTFETLISFIISANNNIPRIKLIVERLCQNFGQPLEYGEKYYMFPTPERLAACSLEDLSVVKAGFRDKYILDAARKVVSGDIQLEQLKAVSFAKAKAELMRIKGVGEKVANCIVLFGLGHYSAFPIDVWIKRIIDHYYFGGEDANCDIGEFAKGKFGDLGGFAQQYLFYYARENKVAK